jgi:hypothetical protein
VWEEMKDLINVYLPRDIVRKAKITNVEVNQRIRQSIKEQIDIYATATKNK